MHEKWNNVAVSQRSPVYLNLSKELDVLNPVWTVKARSHFLPKEYDNFSDYDVSFTIVRFRNGRQVGRFRQPWTVPIAPSTQRESVPMKQVERSFVMPGIMGGNEPDEDIADDDFIAGIYDSDSSYQLEITTTEKEPVPISLTVVTFNELTLKGIIMAGAVLIFLYVLIIFEVVHRTLAAMLGAVAAIACLTITRDVSQFRPCTFVTFYTLSDPRSSASCRGSTRKLWRYCSA